MFSLANCSFAFQYIFCFYFFVICNTACEYKEVRGSGVKYVKMEREWKVHLLVEY